MKKRMLCFFMAAVFVLLCFSGCHFGKGSVPTVGIAWSADKDSESLTNVTETLDSLNCKWVLLDQVVCSKVSYSNGVVAEETFWMLPLQRRLRNA